MLIPGLALLEAEALAQRGALLVSRGTSDAASASAELYDPEARVPRLPWERATSRDVDSLRGREGSAASARIQLLRPCSAAAARAAKRVLALVDRETQRPDVLRAGRELLQALARQHGEFRFASEARLAQTQPGLLTNTRDASQAGRLLGLHVDSHERRPIAERAVCRRLLVGNLSREVRSLLFVNLELEQLKGALPVQGIPRGRFDSATDLARAFLRAFPEYPVLRLLLQPGEAYLAPVQNMVHDGCTLDMRAADWTVRAFGELDAEARPIEHRAEGAHDAC